MVKVCFFPFRIQRYALNFFLISVCFLGNHILLVKGGKILATPIKRGPFLSETRAFVTHCVWV